MRGGSGAGLHVDGGSCLLDRLGWRAIESGGGGIRTHETAQHRLAVFKTAPFDRSGTPPAGQSSRWAAADIRLRAVSFGPVQGEAPVLVDELELP
jgi:hypothetical protein